MGRGFLFFLFLCMLFLFVCNVFLYLFISVIVDDCTLYKFVLKKKKKERKKERKKEKVIECLQYLRRQGITMPVNDKEQ